MHAHAVMFYGIPGAGKGTQADLLARARRWIHFDTGPHLKSVLYDPGNQDNPAMREQKRIWDAGELNDPAWVLSVTAGFALRMAACEQSIVFSGSPRTFFEAFGDEQNEGLVDLLARTYKQEQLHFFFLNLPHEGGGARNRARRLCSACKLLIISNDETTPLTRCVTCGAPLETRVILDAPEKYAARLTQFNERTLPVLAALRERGFSVKEIRADQEPWQIHQQIVSAIDATYTISH